MTAAIKSTDVEALQGAVQEMDQFSQVGFSRISALAKLALSWMEKPDCYQHPEVIARAFEAIWAQAADSENQINSIAEEVGCHFVDADQRQRDAARLAHSKGSAA